MNPAIYEKIPYSPLKDFVPISMIGTFPLVIVVKPGSPFKSVKDLVEFAEGEARRHLLCRAIGSVPARL